MKSFERYNRQVLLPTIGEVGQQRLLDSTVLVVGCGALGTMISESLARSGVGKLHIVDRDFVELSNLQRQVLFDEEDARAGLPKAEAARDKLQRINSTIEIKALVADFNSTNALRFAECCDVIVDGTDNFETRFLINDVAVKLGKPYVYGGVVGTTGTLVNVLPKTVGGDSLWEKANIVTPCLRCLFEQAPPPGSQPTCDTAGVLGPMASMIANAQVIEAIKVIVGDWSSVNRQMIHVDCWTNQYRQLDIANAQNPQCPCCGERRFDYLENKSGSVTTAICGRMAVQVLPAGATADEEADPDERVDFKALALRLKEVGQVSVTRFTLRAELPHQGQSLQLTLFPDGRAIIQGTKDVAIARTVYSKYIGL